MAKFGIYGLSLTLALMTVNARALDSDSDYDPGRLSPPTSSREVQRVWIENTAGGQILGSKDGGRTWKKLGSVKTPILGEYWRPTEQGGVLAFNFQRGASQVFSSAVNALHLRFSDPSGYTLPQDPSIPLVAPRAVSIMPFGGSTSSGSDQVSARVAQTDIPAGTSLFGPEWAPKVGSKIYMGDGVRFAPIPYEYGPDERTPERKYLLIITERHSPELESIEFENRAGGFVTMKRWGEKPITVAKVLKPVLGIGRFEGSEHAQKVGVLRANHPGVLCIATTDIATDPEVSKPVPKELIANYRGGFQIVPSHHYQDSSMNNGNGHGFVYMVVGPLKDPPHLKRYDMGLDGSYPIFSQAFRAGQGRTYFRFKGESQWIDLRNAIRLGRFKAPDGSVAQHLRGVMPAVFSEVEAIRYLPETWSATAQ